MINSLPKILNNRWLVALTIIVMVGVLPVYAAVRSVITSDEKIDASKPASSQVASKDEKNPEKTEKSSNDDSSAQATVQSSTTPIQPIPSTATPTQSTPVSREAQPPQVSTDNPEPANSYVQGSGAWWADKRWAELGYGTQYLGETCWSWRTRAQAAGVSIVGGPDLHRIVCQDVSGYSSFGFIEQVRPDGYVVSAYNWAGEAGPKQLVMTSFNGFSLFAPKQTTN